MAKRAGETPEQPLVALLAPDGAGELLSIGDAQYPVVDGRTAVAPEHLEAALAAGFRIAPADEA
jgi:hypothetical protein